MLIRKFLAGLILLTLFVGALASAHYYLLKRIALDGSWPAPVAAILVAMMLVGFSSLVVHGLLWRRLGITAKPMSWIAYIWMGVTFYLLVSTAATELATTIFRAVGPDQAALVDSLLFLRARALVIVTLATVASMFALRGGLAPPAIKRVEIALKKFPQALNGFRIVQISDIHIGPILDRRFSRLIAERVTALEPDLVAVTGDLVDGRVSHLIDEVAPFAAIDAPYGVFFVTGNHDYYSGAQDWTAHVASFGWRPLRNESVPIEQDGDGFELVGVDDPHGALLTGEGGEDLGRALDSVDPKRAIVLLAHDPATFRRAR
ncbi:MAG: metallophosphoesterase, partial [Myxococcota bacterium]